MRIVLTGGPCSGKTALTKLLAKEFRDDVTIVPEVATILYQGGFPRAKHSNELFFQQRAIYQVQIELEGISLSQQTTPHLIYDRGTLDQLAYWPESAEHFFRELNTSLEKEIERYDFVIHIDTIAREFYRQKPGVRTETYEEAMATNKAIKEAWEAHPKRWILEGENTFDKKAEKLIAYVHSLIQ